jgi:uncharacterized membrane protein YagU involved in acid resistance
MTLFDVITFSLTISIGYLIAEFISRGSGWAGALLGVVAGFLLNHYLIHRLLLGYKRKSPKQEKIEDQTGKL